MKIDNRRIDFACGKIVEYSLYCLVFFLPASKSMVEVCATTAFFAWLVRKINNLGRFRGGPTRPSFFYAVVIANLVMLIPLAVIISSTLSTHNMDLSIATPLPSHIALIVSLIAIGVLGIIVVSLYYTPHIDLSLKLPFLLLLDIAVITSMFTSRHIEISLGAFFFKMLEYLLIFFMMAEVINTKRRFVNILIAISASSFIVGLDGIYQIITKHDFLRGFPLYAGKMTASFQFPNNFGGYLTVALPIFISFIIRGTARRKIRISLLVLSALLMVCLVFTQARGAWLGFIVGLFVVSLFSGKKTFFITIAFLIILFSFSPAVVKDQVKSFARLSTDTSTDDRVIIWKTGWKMFTDRPVFGHGLGTFMNVFSGYKPKSYSEIVYAHNCYLQMAAEIGITGLLIFLWFLFALFKSAVFRAARTEDKFLKAALTGITAGILGYLAHSFFDTNLFSLSLAVLFWSMAGLAAANIESE